MNTHTHIYIYNLNIDMFMHTVFDSIIRAVSSSIDEEVAGDVFITQKKEGNWLPSETELALKAVIGFVSQYKGKHMQHYISIVHYLHFFWWRHAGDIFQCSLMTI